MKEIGRLGGVSETYVPADLTLDEILHDNFLHNEHFGLKLHSVSFTLPIMYWMPKMHKNPVGFRFIVASSNCSTKPISKAVSAIFNLIYNQTENFHQKAKFLSNYNKFWVLKDVSPITDIIKKVNSRNNAKSISTFDFSTLYTKLPHRDLIDKLSEVIDLVFEGGKNNCIRISKNGRAYWGKWTSTSPCFSKTAVKQAMQYLIENCYFSVGNCILRQCIGIPMGIDPAPFWANLFLYVYECNYMSNLVQTDRSKSRLFFLIRRFIDDLCAINDDGEFGRVFREIYPPELELKLEHSGQMATFLNLHIQIMDGKFVYKLFDKRNNFPFSIVRMPHRERNIPESIFYSALAGEFLRISRSSMLQDDLVSSSRELVSRMKTQGGKVNRINRVLSKVAAKHSGVFASYEAETHEIIRIIVQ